MFIQVKEFLNKKQVNKRINENSIALHQPINDLIKKKKKTILMIKAQLSLN